MRKTILLIMIILFSSLAYSVALENPTGANYAVDGATMYLGTTFKVNESNLMITRAIYNLGASCTPSIKEFSGDGNPVGESIINFTPCTTSIFCNATTEVLLDQSKEYIAGMVCTAPGDARYDATGSLPIFGPTLNYTDDKYDNVGNWADLNGRQDGGLITLETDDFSGPTGDIIFNMPNNNPQTNNTQILFDINCTNPADISNLYFNLSTEFNLITNNTNKTIWQTNITTEGSYNYFATCNDTVNSSVRIWTYDISIPGITINPTSFFNANNQTTISRLQSNKLINITFTDNIDLFAYEINITNSSGVSRYFNNSESLSGLSFDFTAIADFSTWDLGEYNTTIIVTDSHTALTIDDYAVIPKTKELRFLTDEENDIRIKSEYKAIPTYNKLEDRYEFSFQFQKELFSSIPDEKVFRVYCDNELIERKDSKYKGHIICWNPETKTGNWLDFEGVDGPITITQKMDLFFTQYLEVKINTKDTLLNFHSIGGLNSRTTHALFNLSSLFPFNPYLEVGTPYGLREWNRSNEFSGIDNISINKTILNNILDNKCVCDGCSIVDNNCRIPFLFHSDVSSILEYSQLSVNTSFGIEHCSNPLFNFTVLNFSYFDALDNTPIQINNNYELLFDSLSDSEVNASSSNSFSDAFCTNVNYTQRNFTYSVTGQSILTKTLYATEIVDFTEPILISEPTFKDLFMIKLNESSTVIFNWLTNTYEPIIGTMLISECNGNGTKTLINSIPIINGEATANIELLNTAYSYQVLINGVIFADETDYTRCHIESETERDFFVNIGSVVVPPIVGMYSIPCNLTKTGNHTVKMEWGTNPESTSTITGCIEAYRMSAFATTMNYQNCSTGTLFERTIPNSGFDYIVKGKLFQEGYSIECGDVIDFKTDKTGARQFGLIGILSIFFLVTAFVLWFSDNARTQQLGVIVGLAASFVLGIFAFQWITVASLISFVVIIMIIGRRGKKQ